MNKMGILKNAGIPTEEEMEEITDEIFSDSEVRDYVKKIKGKKASLKDWKEVLRSVMSERDYNEISPTLWKKIKTRLFDKLWDRIDEPDDTQKVDVSWSYDDAQVEVRRKLIANYKKIGAEKKLEEI